MKLYFRFLSCSVAQSQPSPFPRQSLASSGTVLCTTFSFLLPENNFKLKTVFEDFFPSPPTAIRNVPSHISTNSESQNQLNRHRADLPGFKVAFYSLFTGEDLCYVFSLIFFFFSPVNPR